ncbi:hypothetical protein [Flavobacterium sp. ACN6]|uniref:hypothetical protein n=1 Tax=Flavobacterium sp. ACN6 TaxID=1920426 RepID=UPI000BB387C8|nr:hypothetical protein [Flavobacterium sp. ACN6]PBJ12206.1 hypothetical protein BSF42_21610 [Flavobacterium sp. ACN6]
MKVEDRIEGLLELIKRGKYFTKLKQQNKMGNTFIIPLQISSYNELNMMVSDLLKASIILLNPDAKGLSSFTNNSDINVMTLIEIALQLLPEDEMELLDDLCKLSINFKEIK